MKRLAIYLMAEPQLAATAEAAVEGGADLLEIGFPFSDPLADGPVIRRAAERALAAGMGTERCMECVAEVRSRVSVPLVVMTYASVLEAYGPERFARDARSAGTDSLIVADLPVEAAPHLRRVQLVAPVTPTDRLRLAAVRTDGWLYLVSVMGTTGPRHDLPARLPDLVRRARSVTGAPLLAGFGIATPEQAARAGALTDGIVVGSRAIEVADESGPAGLRDLVTSLRRALDETPAVQDNQSPPNQEPPRPGQGVSEGFPEESPPACRIRTGHAE